MKISPLVALALLPITFLPAAALAKGLQDYAIYAGQQINFSSSINVFNAPLGLVGSSGDISFAPATVRGTTFQAAGSMLGTPNFLTANSLLFNGNVQVNGLSTISGDINAGGTVSIAATANGNTTAAGNITLSGTAKNLFSNSSINLSTFGNITGNATAAQNLTLAQDSSIAGSATYGGSLSVGTFSTIGGPITHAASTITPASFTPVPIIPDNFTSGGSNVATVFATTTVLAPGSYGNISINKGTLELSPGKYFFNSVISDGSFMTLNLRLDKPGNIEIYVAGDYSNALQVTEVNGTDLESSSLTSSIASLASRVLIESHGNISLGWDNLGTLYAPSGNTTLASLTDEFGSVLAGNTATFSGGDNVYYYPLLIPNLNIPEPTTALLLLTAAPLLLRKKH